MASHQHHHHHFLVATLDAHGHINPARILARRLTSLASGTRVTLAIPTTAFRRMFPSSTDEVEEDGDRISFSHFSDGREDGLATPADLPEIELRSKENLSRLVLDLARRERPVTCIVYALLMTMAIDVARELGIPSVLFWIQPAAVFAIYYHYFHGYADFIDARKTDTSYPVELPGLPPLTIGDLPSFLSAARSDGSPLFYIYFMFEDMFRTLDREPTLRVLVNTFEELEAGVLSSDVDGVEMIPVGPMVNVGGDGLVDDEGLKEEYYYMDWLDSKDEGSVVYLFFGSITSLTPRQIEEISRGLRESGRPFLWALKQKNIGGELGGEMGMVVEWCSQARVLAHRSVGCFVTHCGWNSTLESLMCGVPIVMIAQWTEQVTTARLAEGEWGVGVRGVVGGNKEEKLVDGRELRRCVDLVMGDGERGTEIKRKASVWRDKAREAAGEGGSSSRNLNAFIGKFSSIMLEEGDPLCL